MRRGCGGIESLEIWWMELVLVTRWGCWERKIVITGQDIHLED